MILVDRSSGKHGDRRTLGTARSPTHKSQPDAGGGELDEREVVGVVLFEASGDSSEVLNLVEEHDIGAG